MTSTFDKVEEYILNQLYIKNTSYDWFLANTPKHLCPNERSLRMVLNFLERDDKIGHCTDLAHIIYYITEKGREALKRDHELYDRTDQTTPKKREEQQKIALPKSIKGNKEKILVSKLEKAILNTMKDSPALYYKIQDAIPLSVCSDRVKFEKAFDFLYTKDLIALCNYKYYLTEKGKQALSYEEERKEQIEEEDIIKHPKHYTSHPSGIECIEITRHMNFNLGNAMKYNWRAGLKNNDKINDLRKAIEYLEDEIWKEENMK